MWWGEDIYIQLFLTSAPDECTWSTITVGLQGANNQLIIKIQILRYVKHSLGQDMWHV
jgi:hypothetical protein